MYSQIVSDFNKDLNFAEAKEFEGVWSTLYSLYFGTTVYLRHMDWKHHAKEQRQAIDYIVSTNEDFVKPYNFENKADRYAEENYFLEVMSAFETQEPGWMEKHVECDYIAYFFCQTYNCHFIPYVALKRVYDEFEGEWRKKQGIEKVTNNGYTTTGLLVPIKTIKNLMDVEIKIYCIPNSMRTVGLLRFLTKACKGKEGRYKKSCLA